jgi:hypothetical protein
VNDDLGWLIAAIAALGYLALWIWALIEAGNNGKWGWFIAVFLFSPRAARHLLTVRAIQPSSGGPIRHMIRRPFANYIL